MSLVLGRALASFGSQKSVAMYDARVVTSGSQVSMRCSIHRSTIGWSRDISFVHASQYQDVGSLETQPSTSVVSSSFMTYLQAPPRAYRVMCNSI